MKRKLLLFWHDFRAGYHWNRMKAIAARTGGSHGLLMDSYASYRSSSEKYNESKNYLVTHGKYVTALGLILNKG